MIKNMPDKGRVIKFNIATTVVSKNKNILEFLTIKFSSSFKRTLIRNGGIIIKSETRYNCKLFKGKKLKKIDKMRLTNINIEPKSLKIPSFLPRMLIS